MHACSTTYTITASSHLHPVKQLYLAIDATAESCMNYILNTVMKCVICSPSKCLSIPEEQWGSLDLELGFVRSQGGHHQC